MTHNAGPSLQFQHPHRRYNPLRGDWVLVSPHRTERPWQGQVEKPALRPSVAYDPGCYLCPGNARAAGIRNPEYASTFVFENDYAALYPQAPEFHFDRGGLLAAARERGHCRVVCFSPNHGLTVARMDRAALAGVVETWTEQWRGLAALDYIGSVQIFENRGKMMGASNPHPHCQIWASESVPDELAKEEVCQRDYRVSTGGCLLCDYLALELAHEERLVCRNEAFVALVPFWAVWPFETIILGARHFTALDELDAAEQAGLADILKRITTRYDNLFETPFPYTMGFHQHPTDGRQHPHFHFHAHFYPPLLRSATVR
ncbi:MAG: galactose-1-phosphate uridylyltransferase, partial [Bryobacteraceae bacterium]